MLLLQMSLVYPRHGFRSRKVLPPHPGAPRLSGSAMPADSYQPRCFSWTEAPEISNACLIFSDSTDFPGTPPCRSTFGWEGACASTPQVCAASGSPIAMLGTLPPRGQALAALGTPSAARRKESLEAEEVPRLSPLAERDTPVLPARCACPGAAKPQVPGFLPIVQARAGRARVSSL